MPAGAGGVTDANGDAYLNGAEKAVQRRLHHRLDIADTDTIQIKAHHLDDALEFSKHRIGHALGRLSKADIALDVEPWRQTTSSTVWEVSR